MFMIDTIFKIFGKKILSATPFYSISILATAGQMNPNIGVAFPCGLMRGEGGGSLGLEM